MNNVLWVRVYSSNARLLVMHEPLQLQKTQKGYWKGFQAVGSNSEALVLFSIFTSPNDSHQQPITWSECWHLCRHVNEALLVMHSRQDAPLPVPMVQGLFMRKVSPNDITSKPFRVDAVLLEEFNSRENRSFADLGYRSMYKKNSSDQSIMLKTLLSKLALLR